MFKGVLTDRDIIALAPQLITPFDPQNVQPSSYDLTLYPELLIPTSGAELEMDLDILEPAEHMVRVPITDRYVLKPGEAVLGATREVVNCPSTLSARVEGKSSLGRIFLAVHITAGVVDAGFCGQITLEIVNHGPWSIVLKPGMKIAQLTYFPMNGECAKLYGDERLGSHYNGQHGPTPASGRRALK